MCKQLDVNTSYAEYTMKPLDNPHYLNQMTVPKNYFCQFTQQLPTHQYSFTIFIEKKEGLNHQQFKLNIIDSNGTVLNDFDSELIEIPPNSPIT